MSALPGQAVSRSIQALIFKSVSAIFLARWSRVPMDLGMPMCRRLLISVGYHGALPHSQRNDKFGRMAVRSGEQFFFRQAEGFQTVFNDDFRLVFPYFRGPGRLW